MKRGGEAIVLRAIAFSLIGFVLATILLTFPPLVGGVGMKHDTLLFVLTLIPQALPLSIPLGVCVGIMTAMRARRVTPRHLTVTLSIAFTATCLVWAAIEWAIPRANQAFREMAIAQLTDGRVVHIERGLNELGFSGLARRTDQAAVRHYHLLWALSCASIPLAVFALAVAARIRRATSALFLTSAIVFVYHAILWISHNSMRDGAPTVSAWAPNAVLLMAGLGLLARAPATAFRGRV